jgi:glycosyltransferase involved in cell wall biosynthesis
VKRVALIRNSYSYDVGGAEIFPINLAKILHKLGYVPYVLSSNMRTLEMAEAAKLRYIHSPWWSLQNLSGKRIVLFPAYLVWLLVVAAWYVVYFYNNRIDIVHPQGRDDFVAATLAAKLLRKKVIWTDHADLKYIYANHRKWYKNPVGKLVFATSKLAKQVSIESHSEKRLIEESLGKKLPKNYSVIHIGVVDSYTSVTRNTEEVVIVSTSRLVKDKGIAELIEAMKLIKRDDVVLKICGDGPDAEIFKSSAKGMGNISFLGHVRDVVSVLEEADVFVHPTYHEGFGLSLVEAEMCSLPIVASNVDSIPEIVEDGVSGVLVEVGNHIELAKGIALLIDDSELRHRMGKAGRRIFLEKFQFDKIVRERFVPLYENN